MRRKNNNKYPVLRRRTLLGRDQRPETKTSIGYW